MSWATKRFGKLTILKEIAPDIFFCKCDCGKVIEVWRSVLDARVVRNCGCEVSHALPSASGHIRTYKSKSGVRKQRTSKEHNSWASMNNRCYVKTNPAYENYGGRGITVCERWRRGLGPRGVTFKNFIADMGPRPSGMTLDRKNPNGHYEPDNCRWATAKVQSENRGCVIWKHVEPPPVEDVAAMEARLAENFDELAEVY
jgi:hypothetical protein